MPLLMPLFGTGTPLPPAFFLEWEEALGGFLVEDVLDQCSVEIDDAEDGKEQECLLAN
jgi:hypothetical protein